MARTASSNQQRTVVHMICILLVQNVPLVYGRVQSQGHRGGHSAVRRSVVASPWLKAAVMEAAADRAREGMLSKMLHSYHAIAEARRSDPAVHTKHSSSPSVVSHPSSLSPSPSLTLPAALSRVQEGLKEALVREELEEMSNAIPPLALPRLYSALLTSSRADDAQAWQHGDLNRRHSFGGGSPLYLSPALVNRRNPEQDPFEMTETADEALINNVILQNGWPQPQAAYRPHVPLHPDQGSSSSASSARVKASHTHSAGRNEHALPSQDGVSRPLPSFHLPGKVQHFASFEDVEKPSSGHNFHFDSTSFADPSSASFDDKHHRIPAASKLGSFGDYSSSHHGAFAPADPFADHHTNSGSFESLKNDDKFDNVFSNGGFHFPSPSSSVQELFEPASQDFTNLDASEGFVNHEGSQDFSSHERSRGLSNHGSHQGFLIQGGFLDHGGSNGFSNHGGPNGFFSAPSSTYGIQEGAFDDEIGYFTDPIDHGSFGGPVKDGVEDEGAAQLFPDVAAHGSETSAFGNPWFADEASHQNSSSGFSSSSGSFDKADVSIYFFDNVLSLK